MRAMEYRMGGAVAWVVAAVIAGAVLAGAVAFSWVCPCERTPGGYLFGPVANEPVADWTFANQVRLCEIEVRAGGLPHSINLNCMADAEGHLYLSCASCEGKRWSTAALARPEARLRLDGTVYPVVLTRVLDPGELDVAWQAREAKMGRPVDTPPQDGWWSFRVESRGVSARSAS
jgi:hypothetical protein